MSQNLKNDLNEIYQEVKKDYKIDLIIDKIASIDEVKDLINKAQKILKHASDPISGVIKFLHDRPDGVSMSGHIANHVLEESFGGSHKIPQLVKLLSSHMVEIIRNANSIIITKECMSTQKLGHFLVKQKDRVKFDIKQEKESITLSNISGLTGLEHGVELPIEKIQIQPPKLIVTAKLGLLRPQKILDI